VSWGLILALAALTFGTRALALVALPAPPTRFTAMLDRIPPALFAGLAASALLDADGGLVAAPVLAAAAGALIVAPRRSLPLCLVAGLLAYGIVTVVMP
jgi:branched-subunit amino acid transport protein